MFRQNEKPFTYLNTTGLELIQMKKKVNYLLKNPKEMAVEVNYDEIRDGFIKRNHDGCIDEYLLNYIFGRFILYPEIDSPVNREVFYLFGKDFLINFKDNNDIIALKLAVA